MAESTGALKGIDVVWKYRLASEETKKDAWIVRYTTENSLSKSKDSDSQPTKDGSIVTPGTVETTASVTSYFKIGDETIEKLEDALDNSERMQVWRINTKAVDSSDMCKATYYEGYLTSFEETSNAEDLAEYSMEFALEGSGAKGVVTFDASEIAKGYEFKDTAKVTTIPPEG